MNKRKHNLKGYTRLLIVPKRPNKYIGGIVMAAVAAIGIVSLVMTHAAGNFLALEPENGSLSGPASVVSDTTASGGKFVKFGSTTPSTEGVYPLNTGMINVKDYGAKGDGTTDDTQAIQNAIYARLGNQNPMTIYFPIGTYVVSNTLVWKLADGSYYSYLSFQGQNKTTTIIKLKDSSTGYQDQVAPKAVIFTANGNLPPYPDTGNGNEAYFNYIEDMTINTGSGNPGAIGVDYIANNRGCLCNVDILSSDGLGTIGLSMIRPWPGPLLVKNLSVNGFDTGIAVAGGEYSATMENVTLTNQRVVGLRNDGNILGIRKLLSTNNVPVIQNTMSKGMINLLDSTFTGKTGTATQYAIDNKGEILARNLKTSNYKAAILNKNVEVPGATVSEYVSTPTQTLFATTPKTLNLPIKETPDIVQDPLTDWASVTDYGAVPNKGSDTADGIQKAIDSGKTTVYFPKGDYDVSRPIIIRGNVRTILGFDSNIRAGFDAPVFSNATAPAALFQIVDGTQPVVTIKRLTMWPPYGTTGYKGMLAIEDATSRTLVIKDSKIFGPFAGYRNTAAGTGDVFIENTESAQFKVDFPQNIWMRQFNAEENKPRIINNGGKVWIMGLKTEGASNVLDTRNGGYTELFGALFYPAAAVPTGDIAIFNTESHVSASYATSDYSSGNDYPTQIRETRNGVTKDLLKTALPARGDGLGTIVPLYVGGQ